MKTYDEMAQSALTRGKTIRKQAKRNKIFISAVSLAVLMAIGIGILGGANSAQDVELTSLLVAPQYPQMAQKPHSKDYKGQWEAYQTAYQAWSTSQSQQYNQPDGYADSLTEFFAVSMSEYLQGEGNQAYSPLNVYMALAMLAETTDGDSRQQILNLFGLETIEQLRQQATNVWNAHYSNDGQTSLRLANSLWLDNEYTFKDTTAQLLAKQYFASSFSGDLGTVNMDRQLQTWLNSNTGGLLEKQVKNIELDPDTVFALASTVCFSAGWTEAFSEKDTSNRVFHAYDGDLVRAFMNKKFSSHIYYRGENFGAISLKFTGENKMWLILPDEGYTTADILRSDDYLRLTLDPENWENKSILTGVKLSLPKFDVANQKDLIAGMKNLGVTDIFNWGVSDFSPLTDEPDLFVGKINHAVRVIIDEKGCTAAAFTEVEVLRGNDTEDKIELEFVLDRPFLFTVSSRDNLPLFAGVVNEP